MSALFDEHQRIEWSTLQLRSTLEQLFLHLTGTKVLKSTVHLRRLRVLRWSFTGGLVSDGCELMTPHLVWYHVTPIVRTRWRLRLLFAVCGEIFASAPFVLLAVALIFLLLLLQFPFCKK